MKWVTVKEAADLMGYSTAYFRRLYCDSEAPLVTIREKLGPMGRRRIEVLKADLDRMLMAQIKTPA